MKTKIIIAGLGLAATLSLFGSALAVTIKRPTLVPQTLSEKAEIIFARITGGRLGDGVGRIDPKELAKLLAEMAGSLQIRK